MNFNSLRYSLAVVLVVTGIVFASDDQQKATPPSSSPQVASKNVAGPQASAGPAIQPRDPRYQVHKGDVLELQFPFAPEYNATLTVQPDGFISPHGAANLKVEGQSTPEIQQALQKAYASILHDPVINVVLKKFVSPYFIAYGEVNHPGKFELHGDITASEAIGIAGGFTQDAKHSDVYLFRSVSDQWVSSQKLDLKHMLLSGKLDQDPRLQPGDMLWVPKSAIAKTLYIQPLIPRNTFMLNFGQILY